MLLLKVIKVIYLYVHMHADVFIKRNLTHLSIGQIKI